MRVVSRSWLVGVLLVAACSAPAPSPAPAPPEGPLAEHARAVAAENGVPGDLVLAMAAVEGGLELPARLVVRADDDVPIAGILELRHGYFDSLARGVAITGVPEQQLREDTELGTVAGIRVLAALGAESSARGGDAASFSHAVGTMSGYRDPLQVKDYVARVYRVLRSGGSFPARDGEIVAIPPHPEVPVSLTIAEPLEHALGTPQFPGATWFQTDCTNKCDTSRGGTAVDAIVIHDTEGGWDASVATLQNDSGKSVHYIVDADGSRVGQFVPESYTAWHAGNYCWNQRSVGIEHVGYASKTYKTALYQKSVELVQSIRSRHTVPLDRAHLVGHYQIPNGNVMAQCSAACSAGLDACESSTSYGGANHHTDPGYNWQWCQYMEMLGGTCACNDAWSLFNCTTDGTEVWRCNNGKLEKQDCPNGCTVEALGTPDHCTAPPPDAGAGGSTADASTSDGSASDGNAKDAASTDAAGWPDGSGAGASTGSGGEAGTERDAGEGAAGSIAQAPPAQDSEGDSGSCAVAAAPGKTAASWGAIAFAAAAWAGRRRRTARR